MSAEHETTSAQVAPIDPEPRWLDLGETGVSYTDEGPADGPVAVAVHGVPGSVREFRHLGPALGTAGFRVVRVDMPGFGGTPLRACPRLTTEARASFLTAFVRQLGLFRPTLIGHSAGGPVVFTAVATAPEHFSQLVLINSMGPALHRGLQMPPAVFRVARRALDAPGVGPRLAEQLRRAYRRGGIGASDLDIDDFRVQTELVGQLDFARFRAALRSVRVPTLVASAADDPLIQTRVSMALVETLPRDVPVRHLHFARGGHRLQKAHARTLAAHTASMLELWVNSPTS